MDPLHYFTQSLSLMGRVTVCDPQTESFRITCRSGDRFEVFVGETTAFRVLQNLDKIDRDRTPEPKEYPPGVSDGGKKILKYIRVGSLVVTQGIFQVHADRSRYDAHAVHLMHSDHEKFVFEETHWWLTQISRLADKWLDDLFGDKRTYQNDDFAALYRTNLNILGLETDDNIQECATLSRLIYGLSSAFLLTSSERYRLAAAAGVKYQREAFRHLSHDGAYCFWAFGKRKYKYVSDIYEYSLNGDDYGSIPLYEQIYALAGLAQYYRFSFDREVLEDIRRTVDAFNDFFLDAASRFLEEGNQYCEGKNYGGYFSHLDYVTMRPDAPVLAADPTRDNRAKKNWNSIGDHIPAYLINVILALEPLGPDASPDVRTFLDKCIGILDETSDLIAAKFPDPDESVPYVRERFFQDWNPDLHWFWQQDRAIVGHNLKIAWNLTRVANYWRSSGRHGKAERLIQVARKLADGMAVRGVDQLRGGCFDAVERVPKNGMPLQFPWGNTKDFWQQEQGILAYYILYGNTGEKRYLDLAREMSAFWNLFFLDQERCGIWFRVTENGLPYISEAYGQKGGHSKAGYHAFELNYLAHIYIRSYVEAGGDRGFCLYFKPDERCSLDHINVLPDFVPPGTLAIERVVVGGIPQESHAEWERFRVPLRKDQLGSLVVVEFHPVRRDEGRK